jgi:hypothetical protein
MFLGLTAIASGSKSACQKQKSNIFPAIIQS